MSYFHILALTLKIIGFATLSTALLTAPTTSKIRRRAMASMMTADTQPDILFDVPVSNHGARIRWLIKAKGLGNDIEVKSPAEVGGLQSEEYLRMNAQGKMPLMMCEGNYPLPDSDSIAKYVLDKYSSKAPSFVPSERMQRVLSDQICRTVDLYIGTIQACMYRAPGSLYGSFGSDRKAALSELQKQLKIIEELLDTFAASYPALAGGKYLCGDAVSLGDVWLYSTLVFCEFMLPQFFSIPKEDFLGPRLLKWWEYLSSEDAVAMEIRSEVVSALESWKSKNRWGPIMEELQQQRG